MSMSENHRRVKLIANPGAGNSAESASRVEEVARYFLDHGVQLDIALAHPAREAAPIARKAVKDDYSTVIAMGGDGTVSAVVRGIAGSDVHLGIIPAGTENDIATSLKIPADLAEACALIVSDHTSDLDLAQISTKGEKKFIFFMVVTVGLTTTLYPYIKDIPHGDFSNIKDAFLKLLHAEQNPKVFLTLDDESRIEVETMLVTITNTPVIGAKNLVAPEASMDDGLLDIAVYPGFSKAELLAYFARTADENFAPDGKIQRYRAKKIKLKTSPKLDIAAEGILLGKGKAKIKVLPRSLRVITPEPEAAAEKPRFDATENLPVPVAATADVENHAHSKNGQ